jgi:hypothetical protein
MHVDGVARGAERGEPRVVDMEGLRAVRTQAVTEHHVGVRIERHLARPEEAEPATSPDRLDARRDGLDVHEVRALALDPQHHRRVGAVPSSRGTERAEQLGRRAYSARVAAIPAMRCATSG